MKKTDSKIKLINPYVQLPLRTHDAAIMDVALAMSYTPPQLKRVNCVRIYLGMFYVSELTTPEGTEIAEGILQHEKHQEYRTTMTRPYQKAPNAKSWKLWDRLIPAITNPK